MPPTSEAVVTAADHCTLWPDRLGDIDWAACCAAHDVAYGLGSARLDADIDMALCVASIAGWPMAAVMFAGVTAFGWQFWRRRR